mmetsp:Transcript_58671/g.122585  ORF Transcript_58671/g.122585 Transcript_58671/m.122585 type:complete len:169 (-) Transcript_58671:285-791(-)
MCKRIRRIGADAVNARQEIIYIPLQPGLRHSMGFSGAWKRGRSHGWNNPQRLLAILKIDALKCRAWRLACWNGFSRLVRLISAGGFDRIDSLQSCKDLDKQMCSNQKKTVSSYTQSSPTLKIFGFYFNPQKKSNQGKHVNLRTLPYGWRNATVQKIKATDHATEHKES